MRTILPGDLDQVVRVLLTVPADKRHRLARRLIREAEFAEKHRRRTGRAHPRFGDGTLMTAARRRAAPPLPQSCTPEWLGALSQLIDALLAREGLDG